MIFPVSKSFLAWILLQLLFLAMMQKDTPERDKSRLLCGAFGLVVVTLYQNRYSASVMHSAPEVSKSILNGLLTRLIQVPYIASLQSKCTVIEMLHIWESM